MAREKAGKKPTSSPASRAPTISALRAKIDKVDQQLVKLMNERAEYAHEIGQVKNNTGVAAYAPAREDEVLARVLALSKGPLPERALRAVFRELISGSRSLEKCLRVAYLGPA